MDYEFNWSERRENYTKLLFNKYTVYVLLGILLCMNIILFPDLLNHKDIKLNDMSYLVEHAKKQRDQMEGIKNKSNTSDPLEYIQIIDEEKNNKNNDDEKDLNPSITVNENISKTKRNYGYLTILSLILLALLTSFGVFIYKNINIVRATFLIGKNSNFREMVYPGYELLVD